LLAPGLDRQQIVCAKKEIEQREGISYRQLGRYVNAWNEGGFEALKPKPPWNSGKTDIVPDMDVVLKEAIALRSECPQRSVKDIIKILEMEGIIKPGSIKRSTLQDHLMRAGCSARQLRRVSGANRASRRFAKKHRCELWQSDIKYGPYLPIGKDGKTEQVYLIVFIDDCTRFIVGAGFYASMTAESVLDCFRQSVMRFGKPDALYVDNGKQYGNDLKKACNSLNILLLHTKPYNPEAKGKVEAFNRRVTSFLSEVALAQPKTLDELNRYLTVWIEEYYHKSEHRGLASISPKTAFLLDHRALSFVDMDTLKKPLLHTETRVADKTGCVSFKGRQYEAGMRFAGKKVTISFDPAYKGEIEVSDGAGLSVVAKPLQIGPFCGTQPNPAPTPVNPNGSRMFNALKKVNAEHRTHAGAATSFRAARIKEAEDHV
jgi:transposase InsO family protein